MSGRVTAGRVASAAERGATIAFEGAEFALTDDRLAVDDQPARDLDLLRLLVLGMGGVLLAMGAGNLVPRYPLSWGAGGGGGSAGGFLNRGAVGPPRRGAGHRAGRQPADHVEREPRPDRGEPGLQLAGRLLGADVHRLLRQHLPGLEARGAAG